MKIELHKCTRCGNEKPCTIQMQISFEDFDYRPDGNIDFRLPQCNNKPIWVPIFLGVKV